MASVGRVALSLASGVAETTVAFANFNFDFSIIKMKAPAEYHDVGNGLSKRRRKEAEEGKIHTTARKLGALFAEVVPTVPNLERLYGLRASEIVASPTANPEPSTAHGPFQGYVGLDATSIWAAATSGRGAIQVHLLACLLARQWPASQAVAIWSELVQCRKSYLETLLRDDQFHMGHLMAAHVDIGLEKLAEWDASARAWLHAADKVFLVQQKQLMLIIDNVERSLSSSEKVYDSVLSVWCNALDSLEKVASGMAISVSTPDIFLGLSSWHLYPDMTILGHETKQVSQKDSLIPLGAMVTIGMQTTMNRDGMPGTGISWTIPLARLKYYGRPKVSTSSVGTSSSRVPFERCIQIALGSLISDWGIDSIELPNVFRFFVALDKRCLLESRLESRLESESAWTGPRRYPGWTGLFAQQAEQYFRARDFEQQEITFHVNLGRRRYRKFMHEQSSILPFFGMVDIQTFLDRLDVNDQIEFLRDFAKKNSVEVDLTNAIIFHRGARSSHGEIVSVCEQSFRHPAQPEVKSHRRWILVPETVSGNAMASMMAVGRESIDLIEATGEPCGFIPAGTMLDRNDQIVSRSWVRSSSTAPLILDWRVSSTAVDIERLKSTLEGDDNTPVSPKAYSGWRLGLTQSIYEGTRFRLLCGSGSAALYVPARDWKPITVVPPLEYITEIFKTLQPNQLVVIPLLEARLDSGLLDPALISLFNLYRAAAIYSMIPSATVDPNVALEPLHKAQWPKDDWTPGQSPSESFACIAMFDGGVHLQSSDCRGVMALSSKDTMYVCEALLEFPAKNPTGISCLIGNIGKPGISLLLSPPDLESRDTLDDWQLINHAQFDGKCEDNFRSTSLHLNLTGSSVPLNTGARGGRFTEVMYVEAAVQVFDRGEWRADIDVMCLYDAIILDRTWLSDRVLPSSCTHGKTSRNDNGRFGRITTIDNWPEIIEPPSNTAVVRATGNWTARLALACFLRTRRDELVLTGDGSHLCWECVVEAAAFSKVDPRQLFILL